MAYEPVTIDDFFARFPKYATEDEYYITTLLEEAATKVDDSWIETDFKSATLYYVAHLLESEKGDKAGSGEIVSESFGPMSRTFARNQSTTSLSSTEWGRRFEALRKQSFPGIATT